MYSDQKKSYPYGDANNYQSQRPQNYTHDNRNGSGLSRQEPPRSSYGYSQGQSHHPKTAHAYHQQAHHPRSPHGYYQSQHPRSPHHYGSQDYRGSNQSRVEPKKSLSSSGAYRCNYGSSGGYRNQYNQNSSTSNYNNKGVRKDTNQPQRNKPSAESTTKKETVASKSVAAKERTVATEGKRKDEASAKPSVSVTAQPSASVTAQPSDSVTSQPSDSVTAQPSDGITSESAAELPTKTNNEDVSAESDSPLNSTFTLDGESTTDALINSIDVTESNHCPSDSAQVLEEVVVTTEIVETETQPDLTPVHKECSVEPPTIIVTEVESQENEQEAISTELEIQEIVEEAIVTEEVEIVDEGVAIISEPVSEEIVATIAEPLSEEVATIAEPVSEEVVATVAEPVSEEVVASIAEPVSEEVATIAESQNEETAVVTEPESTPEETNVEIQCETEIEIVEEATADLVAQETEVAQIDGDLQNDVEEISPDVENTSSFSLSLEPDIASVVEVVIGSSDVESAMEVQESEVPEGTVNEGTSHSEDIQIAQVESTSDLPAVEKPNVCSPEQKKADDVIKTETSQQCSKDEVRAENIDTLTEDLDVLYITPGRKGRKSRALIDTTNIVESSSVKYVVREVKQKEGLDVVITPVRRSTRKKAETPGTLKRVPDIQELPAEVLQNAKVVPNQFLNL